MEFKIVDNTAEAVLVEVVYENAMDTMIHSGFSGKEKFVKVTKGRNHTMTVYDEQAKAYCSFTFGENGYTLISDDLSVMKAKILMFLLSEHIQIRNMSDKFETELKFMPPIHGLAIPGQYCVHLGGDFATYLKSEQAIKDVFGEYEIYDTSIAGTGVTVHKAKLISKDSEVVA